MNSTWQLPCELLQDRQHIPQDMFSYIYIVIIPSGDVTHAASRNLQVTQQLHSWSPYFFQLFFNEILSFPVLFLVVPYAASVDIYFKFYFHGPAGAAVAAIKTLFFPS